MPFVDYIISLKLRKKATVECVAAYFGLLANAQRAPQGFLRGGVPPEAKNPWEGRAVS